jgi:hypothetical protein
MPVSPLSKFKVYRQGLGLLALTTQSDNSKEIVGIKLKANQAWAHMDLNQYIEAGTIAEELISALKLTFFTQY